MNEDNTEFTEKFATIEEALKYIAESQAKTEWIVAKLRIESEKAGIEFKRESEARNLIIDKRLDHITEKLNHITELTGIAFDEINFQDEKMSSAGDNLSRKRS